MINTSKLLRNSLKLLQNNLRFNKVQEAQSVVPQGTEASVAHPEEIPVHLRPYDKNKYEVPSAKIKVWEVSSIDKYE